MKKQTWPSQIHLATFSKGDRVQLTGSALAKLFQGRLNRWKGTVTSIRHWPLIGVRRDGASTSELWHNHFWMLLAARAGKE